MEPNKTHSETSREVNRRIAEHVRLQLRIADISQAKAADAIGVPRATFRRRINGDRQLLITDLIGIAQLLDLTVAALIPEDVTA